MATVRREHSSASSTRRPKAGKPKVKRKVKSKSSSSDDGFLSQVGSVEDDAGVCVIVYGKEGVGKTSLCAQLPRVDVKPIFLCGPQEHGIHRLVKRRLVPCGMENIGPDVQSWDEALSALDEIIQQDHDYGALVIDSLTEIQRLCFEHVCDAEFESDMTKEGFFSYQQGPKVAAQRYWPDFIGRLIAILDMGMHVFMTAHTETKPFNNPQGSDYDRIQPDLAPPIWKASARWAGAVLYYEHVVDTYKEGKRKVKATGGESRAISCEFDAAFDGKNSYGLPPYLGPYESAELAFRGLWKKLNPNQNFQEKKSTKQTR